MGCFGVIRFMGGAVSLCVFFFQAEDGIRDGHVTGVQTCALPICAVRWIAHISKQLPSPRRLLEPDGRTDFVGARSRHRTLLSAGSDGKAAHDTVVPAG